MCTSIAVFCDMASPVHCDRFNDHRFFNVLVPLSHFQDGDVWVRSSSGVHPAPDGSGVMGELIPVSAGPCLLRTSVPHAVMPWRGSRVVLAAFVVSSWPRLPQKDLASLQELRFPWPNVHCSASNAAWGEGVGGLIYKATNSVKPQAWGVYYTPEEHLGCAINLPHPIDKACSVPDILRRAVFDLATVGCKEMHKRRLAKLEEIKDRASYRQVQEGHPITKGKRLALFRELLVESGFPDLSVCDFMEEGVSLVGAEPDSPLFSIRPKPMTMTPEQLDSQSVWRRRALLSSPPQQLEPEELMMLNDETEAECKAGFLEGPFSSEAEVSSRLGTDQWSPSQRFLLLQGEDQKPRVIDNLRDSGVNAAFGSSSYLSMHDCDFVTSLCLFVSKVWANRSEVSVTLETGEVLRGPWHNCEWVGRCFDLSKAYKQVPIKEASLKYAVIAMPSRTGCWAFYLARGLPFGGSGSVFSFCKVSKAIWHLAVTQLSIISSVYVDDFPTLEVSPLAPSTTHVFSDLLDTLGWAHATSGKKAVDFQQKWCALGAQFDVSRLHEGSLQVSNKPGRLERILSMAETMEVPEARVKQTAESLHGLLNFAGGFVLGHAFKPVAKLYSALAVSPSSAGPESLRENRMLLQSVVQTCKPRVFSIHSPGAPLVLYTDGSFEKCKGLWGCLLVDPASGRKAVLHGRVPNRIISHWTRVAGQQVICEIELLAVVCARWAFGDAFESRLGFVFVDNESARMTLIKRCSPALAMFRLIAALSAIDAVHSFGAWYERVPSKSNPADPPSRGLISAICEKLSACDEGCFEIPPELEKFILSDTFEKRLLDDLVSAYQRRAQQHGMKGGNKMLLSNSGQVRG